MSHQPPLPPDRRLQLLEQMAAVPQPALPDPVMRHQMVGRIQVTKLANEMCRFSILVGNAQVEAYDYVMPRELAREVITLLEEATAPPPPTPSPPSREGEGAPTPRDGA